MGAARNWIGVIIGMTEQEAIKYIEQHGFIDDAVKDMAIEALEKKISLKRILERMEVLLDLVRTDQQLAVLQAIDIVKEEVKK